MKILYLHGLHGHPGGTKATFLREHGHEVIDPALPPFKFDESVRLAQAAFDKHHPDVVVGSSRGGAVAMNMDSGQAPLVLIAPAWNWNGMAKEAKAGTIILHSRQDKTVPLEHSLQLLKNSNSSPVHLIVVGEGEERTDGDGHEMTDPAALEALVRAVEWAKGVET